MGFTFHYGSILIWIHYLQVIKAVGFTFHYGSILMYLQYPVWFASVNLHSTMVLF